MAGFSLLALIDDVVSVLDDVAAMSKLAAKKTAGVLGDDLALTARQVFGLAAKRELPVVFSVAKGSLLNKAALVPGALLISRFAPWLIRPLLMAGGAWLCLEGGEKAAHWAMSKFAGHGKPPAEASPEAGQKTSLGDLPEASPEASSPDPAADFASEALPGPDKPDLLEPALSEPALPGPSLSEAGEGLDLAALERKRIKGAVRTDLVLST